MSSPLAVSISQVAQKTGSTEKQQRPPRAKTRTIAVWKKTLMSIGFIMVAMLVAAIVAPTDRIVRGGGYVMTDDEAEVRPSVEGAIENWESHTGDIVEKDQLLMRLRCTVQRAELEQARSELSAKQAELKRMESSQDLERAQLKEQIARAEQNMKMASNYLNRLIATGSAAREVDLDEARVKVELASSQLAELRLQRATLQERQVAVVREEIESGQRRVATYEAQVKLREVRAPLKGMVQFNRYEPGEVVKPDHVLGQVFDRSKWIAKLKLPEDSLAYIKVDQDVSIGLAAYSTFRYGYVKGKITRITPVITPQATGNGIYYVEAALEAPKDIQLQPGMTATGYVTAGRTRWLFRVLGW